MNLPRVLSKKEPVWSAIVIICLAATFLYFGIIAFAIEVIVAIAISKFFDGRKEIVKEMARLGFFGCIAPEK